MIMRAIDTAQAAQMLSQSSRPPRTSSARPDYNKPAPPVPSTQQHSYRPDERYGGRPASYEQRPPPGAYNDRYDSRYDSRPNTLGSPPPANYGHGPPPQSYHNRPPIAQRPPPTPAPPRDGNDRDALWKLFGAVDRDGSGALTEAELRTALVNGDWSPFDPHTVRMMIRYCCRLAAAAGEKLTCAECSTPTVLALSTLTSSGKLSSRLSKYTHHAYTSEVVSGVSSPPGAVCSTVSTQITPAAYPTLSLTKP